MTFPSHKAPASGAQSLIGYNIDLTAPDGSSRVVLDVQEQHLNRNGTLHGGIHSMMLDAAAGFAASRRLADGSQNLVPVVTLSLTTSFLGAGGTGQVIATGKVTGGGHKIIYGEAEIHDSEGRLLSKGAAVFKRITP
ncbi:MAG: PaaI family thioesterase [Aliishimia sp.]